MLFSPGKSIFLYAPPLILSIFLWPRLHRRHPPLAKSLLILTFSVLFFYGAWWSWHGGWVWGPRFLVPLVPLWCLSWGEIPARRWWIGTAFVLFIFGLAIQIPGAFTSIIPHYAEVFGDAHPDDATRYAMVHYVPSLSPIVAAFEQVRDGWWEGQAIFRFKDTGAEGEWVGGLPLALGLILGACLMVIWQEFKRP
jgi:hypothetical protein